MAQALLLATAIGAAHAAEANETEQPHFSTDAVALYQRVSQLTPPAASDVFFIDFEETLVFDADGRVNRSWYVLYKVLTKKGAEGEASVSFSWEPWRQERPSLRARVITSDNVVHILDEKTITDAPAKENQDNVFSNRRIIRAPLPAVAPGALVEEEETFKESPIFPGAGTLERFYFGASMPIHHTRLVLDAPRMFPSATPCNYCLI